MKRLLLAAFAASTILSPTFSTVAQAQLHTPGDDKSFGDYSLHEFAAKWMMQQDDIAELKRYRDANRALLADKDSRRRIVFIGDSITEFWKGLEAHSDSSVRWVNRGISGSNTSQMLMRFEDDAIALKPDTVVIMGGTNDLRAYVGSSESAVQGAFDRVTRNIAAMADIAAAHDIHVIICAVPPVGPDLDRVLRNPDGVRRINAWLATFAQQRGFIYLDYGTVLADRNGWFKSGLSDDSLHPNDAGYAAMMPLIEKAVHLSGFDRFGGDGFPPKGDWLKAARGRSPERLDDGRVRWRYFDPKARKVVLTGDAGTHPLERDARGVWTYSAKLDPGTYAYSFEVNDVPLPDPANPTPRAGHWWPSAGESVFRVESKGEAANSSDELRVAHIVYKSDSLGASREFYVYTPPGYDIRRAKPYPVLYLFHGLTDNAGGWLGVGQMHEILDRAIAAGKVEPMVVVMPTGYGVNDITDLLTDPARQRPNLAGFEKALFEEVMPRVEKSFHVSTAPAQTAVAGLSMGGMEATHVGLNHPDRFAYVGAFSPAYQMLGLGIDAPDYGAGFTHPASELNSKLRLFWMSNGDDDAVVGQWVTGFRSYLAQQKINYRFVPRKGGHVWSLWRDDFEAFSQLLFKDR